MPRTVATPLMVVGAVLLIGGVIVLATHGHDETNLGYAALLFGGVFVIIGFLRRRR